MSSDAEISAATYGKSGVRVLLCTDVAGNTDRAVELTLSIMVEGEFLESYRSGDNTAVLPSDTFRRHALAACADAPADTAALVEAIAQRIMAANPAITAVTVAAAAQPWLPVGSHTFVGGAGSTSTTVVATRTTVAFSGSTGGVQILLSTGSAFTGFMRDGLTTQTDAADRPLSGTLEASWTFAPGAQAGAADVVDALVAALTDHPSNAVQQWITAAGETVLDRLPTLATLAVRFASIPIIAVAPGDPDGTTSQCFELGDGPLGVTEVALLRR